MNIPFGFFRAFGLALCKILLTVIGFPLVALALRFRIEHPGTEQPFSTFPGTWRLITLPTWAKWFSNEYDGSLGDKRGWWDNYCRVNFEKGCDAFYSMWQWTAVRNPVNYWSRHIAGVDVSRCEIVKIAGQDVVEADAGFPGWQLLCAKASDKCFPRFFAEIPLGKDHVFLIDIGWKIKLAHAGVLSTAAPVERFKGLVFTVSPWKTL